MGGETEEEVEGRGKVRVEPRKDPVMEQRTGKEKEKESETILVSPGRSELSCDTCWMTFPSRQALSLHGEICQEIKTVIDDEGEEGVTEPVEGEEISIKEESLTRLQAENSEPLKKRARRPPPALIPL